MEHINITPAKDTDFGDKIAVCLKNGTLVKFHKCHFNELISNLEVQDIYSCVTGNHLFHRNYN